MALKARFEQLPTGATKVVFCNFNYGIPSLHRSLIENNMRKLQRLIEMRIKQNRLVRLGENVTCCYGLRIQVRLNSYKFRLLQRAANIGSPPRLKTRMTGYKT